MSDLPENLGRDRAPHVSASGGDRGSPQCLPLQIRVCQHTTCLKDGSAQVLSTLQHYAPTTVEIAAMGCTGHCGSGPMVSVLPHHIQYHHVDSQDAVAIVDQHLDSAQPLDYLPFDQPSRPSTDHEEKAITRERSPALLYGLVAIALLLIGATIGWALVQI